MPLAGDIPVEVEERDGRLRRVRIGRVWHPITAIVDAWVREGRWWGAEERREYVALETPQAHLELYRSGGQWRLSRIAD